MTTASHRGGTAHGAVLRWTRAAVITLVAALAVLVHHETVGAITHVPPARASATSGQAGVHHTDVPADGYSMPLDVRDPATAHDDDGACSATLMQHCSAAGVDSVQLPPPHQPSIGSATALPPGAAVGRDVPGTAGRAPPDLSVLSRLLL
ncbi:hypothetical protein ACIBU0_32955 [Streptomyces sp. NPDC049627]|uniref:hypothetical protein n=1 Tax=Streptomyces sp. NPDC049627 TaxID=3365595 RepID=UPI0037876E1D